jgi:hypothetical protein
MTLAPVEAATGLAGSLDDTIHATHDSAKPLIEAGHKLGPAVSVDLQPSQDRSQVARDASRFPCQNHAAAPVQQLQIRVQTQRESAISWLSALLRICCFAAALLRISRP